MSGEGRRWIIAGTAAFFLLVIGQILTFNYARSIAKDQTYTFEHPDTFAVEKVDNLAAEVVNVSVDVSDIRNMALAGKTDTADAKRAAAIADEKAERAQGTADEANTKADKPCLVYNQC